LITTAFLNKDKNIVVIVMNSTETAQPFYLWMDDKEAKSESPAHSMMTLVFPRTI
jgi:glucosylceramidase